MKLLNTYRKQIKSIDRQILKLLNDREKVVVKVGKFKIKNGLKIHHPQVEKKILKDLEKKTKNTLLDTQITQDIWKKIIKMSCNIQKDLFLKLKAQKPQR
jgi:chorismate mutase/prephenate dehydratase